MIKSKINEIRIKSNKIEETLQLEYKKIKDEVSLRIKLKEFYKTYCNQIDSKKLPILFLKELVGQYSHPLQQYNILKKDDEGDFSLEKPFNKTIVEYIKTNQEDLCLSIGVHKNLNSNTGVDVGDMDAFLKRFTKMKAANEISDFHKSLFEKLKHDLFVDLINTQFNIITEKLDSEDYKTIESLKWEEYFKSVNKDESGVRLVKLYHKALHDLKGEASKHEVFKDKNLDSIWRLLKDDKNHDKGALSFEDELGYMISMMRGFTFMLETIDEDMNSDLLVKFHDVATEFTYSNNEDPKTFERGYSKVHGHFGLELGKNCSPEGFEELIQRIEDQEGESYNLELPNDVFSCVDTPSTKAKEVLDTYNKNERSLENLIKCAQELEDSHLFRDGNIRTLVFLFINRELIKMGEVPVIWDNPNVVDAFSVKEIKQFILTGQKKFNEIFKTKN